MTYERFEDLPVWKTAIDLARAIYVFTNRAPFKGQRSLRDQLERAAVSVSNNIAEGFERGTTQELITFIFYARGSAGEVRSMLCLVEGIELFATHGPEIIALKSLAESCSRQLRRWADSLQNSAIAGTRYLDDRLRRREDQKKRAKAFEAHLADIAAAAAAKRSQQAKDQSHP
jgi:four helix bundle protein